MRKVIYYKMARDDNNCFKKVEDGEAIFHQFGVDHEEFESGPGNFSTAIIEKEDGTVENIYVKMIKFIKEAD